MNHIVVITIGDVFGFGHKQLEDYYFRSNKSRDEVRDAWFAAKELLPDCCPAAFCTELEDNEIEGKHFWALKSNNAPMPKDSTAVESGEMLALTLWFLKQGDPDLELELIKPAYLMFCGPDKKDRESDDIGYGCFFQ